MVEKLLGFLAGCLNHQQYNGIVVTSWFSQKEGEQSSFRELGWWHVKAHSIKIRAAISLGAKE